MSLIITPELIDTYLSLTYPRTTHVSFTDSAELLRREFRLLKIRDLVKQPLTIEDFMRRPFNRRSRYLLLGVERTSYRQFYAGCSAEFYCESQLRLGIYGSEPRPLEIVGRGFYDDPRERKLMMRLLERWQGKSFGDRELRVFADDFRLVG
jgi:hypothetical protein